MDAKKEALNCQPEGEHVAGLYQGIDEVASNVTLRKEDQKIVGPKDSFGGRLSLQEYEAISVAEDRRSHYDGTSTNWNKKDVLSMEAGGNEMMAIIEKDDLQEEASIEMIEITGKRTRRGGGGYGGSPGRMRRAPG